MHTRPHTERAVPLASSRGRCDHRGEAHSGLEQKLQTWLEVLQTQSSSSFITSIRRWNQFLSALRSVFMYLDILLSLFIGLKMFIQQQLLLKFPQDEQTSRREEEPSLNLKLGV